MTHFVSLLQMSCSARVFWFVCGLYVVTHAKAEASPSLGGVSSSFAGLPGLASGLVFKIQHLVFKLLGGLAPLLNSPSRGQQISYQRCQRVKVAELLTIHFIPAQPISPHLPKIAFIKPS